MRVYNQLAEGLEKFCCSLYGGGDENNINNKRYKIYCAERGKVEYEQLHPCCNYLQNHMTRANYQARIWRLSLHSNQELESPDSHCWKILEESGIQFFDINWFDCKPAPDGVCLFIVMSAAKNESVNIEGSL